MKTIQLLFVLNFTICIGVLCSAQQKRWTIEECVSHALKNNISIKQSELDIKSNGLDKLAALGNFLPSVNFGGTHSWNIGLNQNITTGLLENQTTQFTSASLSSNITIYNGLQNINRLHRTKLAQLAAQYQLTKMQDDISLFVANAFLEILFNKENLKVQQLQLANDQKQIVRAQELVDAGSVPRGDLFDMKATIASDNQKVIIAENALLLSKLSLAQALQLQDFENFDIADVAVEANLSPLMAEKSETIVDKAKQVRAEIKIAKTNLDVALRDIEIAKGAYKPSLTGFYSFSTRASYSSRIVGIDPSGVPILASPLPLFDQFSDNKGHNFGLQISIPVLNGLGVKTNVARSKLNYERSKIALNQANLDLETNVYKAISDAKGALKTYESSMATLEARQEAFNYAKERFNVGMMNTFDFNQSQTVFVAAQSDLIRSKYDYIFKVKVVELYFGIPIIQKK
jgi:outer membrane protein